MDRKQLESLVEFWNDLTDEQQDLLERAHQVRHYDASAIIHARGSECMGMIRLLSGSARTFMLSPEGREITLYRMQAGETDVLSAACVISQIRFDSQIIAETDCELLVIPAIYLADLKQHNETVRGYIYERLAARFSDTVLVMRDMLFTRVDQRIAQYLLSCDKNDVKITHEEIASRINSSREVVSRVLKDMEKTGMIILKRGRIVIRDRKALQIV